MSLAEATMSPLMVLAVSGRIGSGATFVCDKLKDCLHMCGYETHAIKISDILAHPPGQLGTMEGLPEVDDKSRATRMKSLQDRGDHYRERYGHEVLAGLCVHRIAELLNRDGKVALDSRIAFVIDSLKHPDEVRLLRRVFRDAFLLVGVVASDRTRHDRLVQRKGFTEDEFKRLSNRDSGGGPKQGQDAIGTVVLADYFFANDHPKKDDLLAEASRLMDLIFRIGLRTPTREEVGMQVAAEAASRSACLSRQVGAALYSSEGLILSTGHNDVPQFGGGLYGSNLDIEDRRCYTWGALCYNDKNKNEIMNQLYAVIDKTLNEQEKIGLNAEELAVLKAKLREAIQSSNKIRSLTEFSRAIHAEMDAILSVARKAIAGLIGSTLYVTTFPCHNCAKHIIGSGVHRVVYLEPYEKSLARELHSDAINDTLHVKDSKKVSFDLYGGVSPYKFNSFFRMVEKRKEEGTGKFVDYVTERATRLPSIAQEVAQLERKIQSTFNTIDTIARDTRQLPLKLED